MDLVTIYTGDDACQRCLGWKRVDDSSEQSWKYWEELPAASRVAVDMGWVKPVVCPDCNGSGIQPAEELR